MVDLIEKGIVEEDDPLKAGLRIIRDRLEVDLDEGVGLKEFVDWLSLLLNESNLPQSLASSPKREEMMGAWKGVRATLGAFSNVIWEDLSRGELIKLITESIEEGKYRPAKGEGVKVVGKIELRSGDFDHIFLVGMSHSLYPKIKRDPFHKYYKELGIKVRNSQIDDRYLFFTHLLGAKEGVYITYSKAEGEEKAFASLFVEELKRVVDIDEMEVDSEGITSQRRLQEEFARGLNRGEIYELESKEPWSEDIALKFKLFESWQDEKVEVYKGILKDRDNLKSLADRFPKNFNYSPTLLEDYLSCPFQFIFKRIFKIDDLELDEDMDAITRGNLLHRIMESFYNRLEEKKVSEDNYQRAKRILLEVAKEEIKLLPLFESNFYWEREKELYIKDGRLGVVLEEF